MPTVEEQRAARQEAEDKERLEWVEQASYVDLFRKWRHEPTGSPWMCGVVVTRISERMSELRAQPGGEAMHVAASKQIGW